MRLFWNKNRGDESHFRGVASRFLSYATNEYSVTLTSIVDSRSSIRLKTASLFKYGLSENVTWHDNVSNRFNLNERQSIKIQFINQKR